MQNLRCPIFVKNTNVDGVVLTLITTFYGILNALLLHSSVFYSSTFLQ